MRYKCSVPDWREPERFPAVRLHSADAAYSQRWYRIIGKLLPPVVSVCLGSVWHSFASSTFVVSVPVVQSHSQLVSFDNELSKRRLGPWQQTRIKSFCRFMGKNKAVAFAFPAIMKWKDYSDAGMYTPETNTQLPANCHKQMKTTGSSGLRRSVLSVTIPVNRHCAGFERWGSRSKDVTNYDGMWRFDREISTDHVTLMMHFFLDVKESSYNLCVRREFKK